MAPFFLVSPLAGTHRPGRPISYARACTPQRMVATRRNTKQTAGAVCAAQPSRAQAFTHIRKKSVLCLCLWLAPSCPAFYAPMSNYLSHDFIFLLLSDVIRWRILIAAAPVCQPFTAHTRARCERNQGNASRTKREDDECFTVNALINILSVRLRWRTFARVVRHHTALANPSQPFIRHAWT